MSITIQLNGCPQRIPEGSSLAALLAQLGVAPPSVATAVNAEFVARAARADCLLQDGDQVLTFQPITGG